MKSFLQFLILVLLSTLLSACSGGDSFSKSVLSQCRQSNMPECSGDCVGGKFHYCYVDPKYYQANKGWRAQCYGVHVGRSCRPCNNEFFLNFGGAMREVTCKEFFKSLENKNNICGDCLERVENI